MCVGCAVVLCDFAGVGPMVPPERFDELRPMNFGGGVLIQPSSRKSCAAKLPATIPMTLQRSASGLERKQVCRWRSLSRNVFMKP